MLFLFSKQRSPARSFMRGCYWVHQQVVENVVGGEQDEAAHLPPDVWLQPRPAAQTHQRRFGHLR